MHCPADGRLEQIIFILKIGSTKRQGVRGQGNNRRAVLVLLKEKLTL